MAAPRQRVADLYVQAGLDKTYRDDLLSIST
jgi:hypothetical protein